MERTPTSTQTPHVVVIGAGFGGTRVVRGLRGSGARVTLVDRNNFHTFQPLLYQVATAGLEAGEITFPARALLRRHPAGSFVMGEVTDIDLDERTVTLDGDRALDYDHLVIAAGAVTTSYGVPGVDEHAFALKDIGDAVRLRAHLIRQLEQASLEAQRRSPVRNLGVVVVGGGPTGVETAGGLRELFDKVLTKDYPELRPDGIPITLVEAADRLLTPFQPISSARALHTLARRGTEVRLGVGVDHLEAGAVVLADGTRLEAGTIVWAAGVTASPLARMMGTPTGRGGRLQVEPNLSLPGHPEVFAIGDIAAATATDGSLLPQVAQPAIQGGVHVAREIVAAIEGRGPTAFRYLDKGSMATIGRNQAVAELPYGIRLSGRLGWAAWLGLHLVYLMGFRNRVATLVNWTWNYVTFDRSARVLIPAPDPAGGDGSS